MNLTMLLFFNKIVPELIKNILTFKHEYPNFILCN